MKRKLFNFKKYFLIGIVLMLTFSCQEYINLPPEITKLIVVWNTNEIKSGESISIICFASDPEGDEINYNWVCSDGNFEENGLSTITYNTPSVTQEKEVNITVFVGDIDNPNSDSDNITLTIVPSQQQLYTKTIECVEDSYVYNMNPDDKHGLRNPNYLYSGVMLAEPIQNFETFIKFKTSDIPSKSRIDSVFLKLSSSDNILNKLGGNQVVNFEVYYVPDDSWAEETLTYNNKPYHESIVIGMLWHVDMGISQDIYIDITDNFLARENGKYNVMVLSRGGSSVYGILNSKESGNPSKLVIYSR